MRIGELAERTGVSRRALRYYEEQGLLVPLRRSNGYREYADDAPVVVEQIQSLYAAGLDSVVIARFLPCAHGHRPRLEMCDDLRAALVERDARLRDEEHRIRDQRSRLRAHLDAR